MQNLEKIIAEKDKIIADKDAKISTLE